MVVAPISLSRTARLILQENQMLAAASVPTVTMTPVKLPIGLNIGRQAECI